MKHKGTNKLQTAVFAMFIISMVALCVCVSWAGFITAASERTTKELETTRTYLQKKLEDSTVKVTLSNKVYTKPLLDLVSYEFEIVGKGKDKELIRSEFLNETALREWIESMFEPAQDAYIGRNAEGAWTLYEETYFRNIDVDKVYEYISKSITEPTLEYSIDEFRIKPETTMGKLKYLYDSVQWLNDFTISYGGETVLSSHELNLYVRDFELDDDAVNLHEVEQKLREMYETAGDTVKFMTTAGDEIDVTYVTYGKTLDWDSEEALIREALEKHISLNQDAPKLNGYEDWSCEYVEISIDAQHLWHYANGGLCCESDCVTGFKNWHDTPTGVYYITERISGKYLTGADYKTWVDKWMRLTNSGIGLHDASWRKSFGGDIYTRDGSHGCINLPSSYAYSLFNEVSVGTAVIIY